MSHSPFLANRQRVLAAQAGQAQAAALSEPDAATEAGQEYATLRAVLHDNLRKLQDVESHEARLPMKAEFVEHFAPWVKGVVEADKAVQDEIVLTCMVWLIDLGYFDDAIKVGAFAIKHGLTMPERYNRSVACFLREDIAEIALKDAEAVAPELLIELDQLTADADMPDQAKAKLNKALGLSWMDRAKNIEASDETGPAGAAAGYAQEAVDHLARALKLDEKSGVKTALKSAVKLLRELTPSEEKS